MLQSYNARARVWVVSVLSGVSSALGGVSATASGSGNEGGASSILNA